MAKIKLFTYNIFEEADAVTVTGTPDVGYPVERLYDRSIGFFWKDAVTEAKTFKADQGASGNLDVDTLIIDRHNFNGKAMTWEYSDNDSDWTPAVTGWAQGDNNQIVKTLSAALTHRYWRMTVASITDPQCSEIFMSFGYEFQVRFDSETPDDSDIENVIWTDSIGGVERSTKQGDLRRIREYPIFFEPTVNTLFKTAIDYLSSFSKPFYIKDHEDDYWFCRLITAPGASYPVEQNVMRNLVFKEMI